ncbi:MAG: hypothetical protein ACTSRS_20285 [Candidatus Helarchaeota archaeon]
MIRKQHKKVFLLILFIFTLIFIGLIPTPFKLNTQPPQTSPETPIQSAIHNTISGVGYGLNYTEFANRTDTSALSLYYDTSIYGSGSATTTLATNWEGYMLDVYVYDLTLNRTYLDNYNFENGQTGWTEVEVDTGWNNIETSGGGDDIYVEADAGPGGAGDDCARVQQRGVLSGSYYRFDNLDRAAFSQQITIQGSNVLWAGIEFDYRADSSWASSLFHAYIRVGTTEVWKLSYGPLDNNGLWMHQDMLALNTTPFTSPVTIEIGLQSDASVGYSSRPNPTFRYDNLRLYIVTNIAPSLVSLQMNSLAVNDITVGSGSVTQIPGTRWLSSPPATFTWGPIPNRPTPDLPASIDFNVEANLFALKKGNLLAELTPGAYGTDFLLAHGINTSWVMYTLIATPDGYWNHYYNFTKPLDWQFTGLYEPQNPTVNIINKAIGGGIGDSYLQINLTDITNSPAGYWRLTAESPNYVTEVTPTDAGTPTTNFRIGNTLRVRATITSASTGYANLSLYDPTGTLWNTEVIQPGSDQFFFSDINLVGASTPAGEYETVVWWTNRTAASANDATEGGISRTTFTVTHATSLESYDISTIQTANFNDVLYNETFVLKAKYTDTDNGLGIDNALVQVEWIDGINYTMTGLGGGFYQIDSLNTSQAPGVYPLTIYANKQYFDSATKQITVELAHHTSLTPNVTSVTVDWGESVTLQVFYNDTDINAGITGASIWVSGGWQDGYWTNGSLGAGYYSLSFDTTWALPDTTYDIDISADLANYQLKTRQISIYVRARSSELTYIPSTAVPIKDSINITLNFIDGVNGSGISNGTSQLQFLYNSSLSGFSAIYEVSPGVFNLEVNTSAPTFTQPGNYIINLAAKWSGIPYYQNQTIQIKFTVRQIITSLTYDPPGNIPYGNNVNLTVHYRVTDADSKFNGLGINNAQINITTVGYTYGLNYTVVPDGTAAGDYIVTIYNNTLNSINSFSITVEASGLTNYASDAKSLSVTIRKLYSSLIITPPGSIPYRNNVNISLQVVYSDSASQWYDGQPVLGLSSSDFSITGTHIFNIYELGNGNYIFEVLNGTSLSIGTYNEYIALIEGALYLSDNRSVSWTVRKLITTVEIAPISDLPYGNEVIATVTVSYDDSASLWYNGQGITGLTTGNFNLTGGHSFSITEIGGGVYTLTIVNTTVLILNTYVETLSLSEGTLYQGDSTQFSFTVRNLLTELVADLVPAQPIGEDVIITVHYQVKDTASLYYNGQGIIGAQINITTAGYNYGSDYSVSEIGNGEYQITILSSKLGAIQSYSVDLKASDVTNYANATTTSSFEVRAIATSFTYVAPSPAPWGTNVTIDLSFAVEDGLSSQNGNPLAGAYQITVNESDPSFTGGWVDLGSGNYQIELNTTGLSMGTYWANISIYMANYINRSILVRFIMRAHFTQVTYDIPDPTPWGKNTTLVVYYEDIDTGFTNIFPVFQITVNETQSFNYNWIDNGDGSFTITLDTTDPLVWPVGSHRVNVKIYQYAYQNSSTMISITIKTRDTDLIYQTPDIIPFLQNATIKIQYRDLKNSTIPVGINNNTNPQIPGLQYSAGNVSISVTILDSTYSPIAATFWIYSMESVPSYGDGWYNITIDTSSLGLTGTYYADINVNWLQLSYYNNQSIRIPFNVRNITALLEYQPPGSTPFAEGGYVSVWLKYTDIDNSLHIDGATVSIYYIEDPNDVQLTPFTIALGNYSVEGDGTPDNNRGPGWYLVKIYMGSDKLNQFGSYDFAIQLNKTNYDTRSISNITFAIRQGYTQFTSPYAPVSYVINGIVNITMNYIDSESGIGIVNTTTGEPVLLSWTWPYNASLHPDVLAVYGWSNTLNRWIASGDTGNYSMGQDGRYQLEIDFSSIPVGNRTIISLNITAGRNVQSQVLNITFITEPQTSVMGVTFPQPVVWGVNSVFNVTYQKIDGTGIAGTVLQLYDLDRSQYWNSSYWNYTTINAATGLFEVTVNTTLYPPPSSGFFRIRVEASGGPYTPRSLNVFLNVRPIDSQVTVTPPAATGWNTLANITIQYYDTYNSVPINDSDVTDSTDVLINVTNVPNIYWTLYNGPSNGYFIVEINTSYWLTLNEVGHAVTLDVSWEGPPYYKNWTDLSIGVPVRARSTDLSYIPALQVPYGENSSVMLSWIDLEISGGVGIENASGKVMFELRDWYNQLWNSSGFAWISDLGNGDYELRINTSKLPTIGSYTFTSYFSWPGIPYYGNRSISFSINVRQINTLLTYTIPAPLPWGNPLQLDLQYNVSDSSSSWDGMYITGALLNITAISNSGGPLTPFLFGTNYTVVENGFGSYSLIIYNTSLDIDSYTLSLQASRYNINIIYKNATASLSFSVRPLTTTLTYTSPLPVPWGNNVSISFNYKVSDSASLYWDGVALTVGTWVLNNGTSWIEGTQYSISGSVGTYIISIDHASVYGNNIGTFQFDVTASSGSNRFLNATSSNVPFTVRALTTSISYIPSTPEPFGNNITMTIFFNISDPESWYYNGVGLDASSWALSNASGSWSSGNDYELTGTGGVYTLTIRNNVYSTIGTFTFDIQANVGDSRYSGASFTNIPFTIRALTTAISYIPAIPEPFGNNVTIQVFFNVSDPASLLYNGMGLDVGAWSLSNASGQWLEGTNYQITGSNGVYTLIIFNNVYSTIGTFSFNIQVTSTSSLFANAIFNNIPFTIRALTTALTYIPSTPIPFGNNVTIRVYFNVSDPASTLFNGMGLGVSSFTLSNVSGSWISGGEYLYNGNSGFFDFTIFANVYNSIGAQYFNIQAAPFSTIYSSATLNNVIFYVRTLTTALSIIPVSPTPYGNNVTGLRVFYNVSDPDSAWNGLGLDASFSLSNVSGSWNVGNEYTVTGGAGAYEFTILSNVYSTVGSYSFDIQATPINNIYATAIFNNVPFTIRALTTALSYVPSLPVPFGNNITIQVFYNVSDPASVLFDGLGLSVNTWTLSNASGQWTENSEYQISGSNGVFSFIILNNVYSAIGSYTFDVVADTGNPIYQTATLSDLPFTVRALLTAITYNPAITQPFGNNVSIEVFFNVSDPESSLDGQGLNVTWILSNSSGQWNQGVEYVYTGSDGAYFFTILNNVYNTIGTFTFDIIGVPPSSLYSNASFSNIPFTIRSLITSLSWTPVETQPWGNPINVTVFFNVSDPVSTLYNGMGVSATSWTLSNSTNSWSAGIEYSYKGSAGVYLFTLDNDSITTQVGSFTFNIQASAGDIRYQSASLSGIPFSIRPLTTQLTYTPVPNIPWGNNVTISFLFNVSDAASLWYNNRGIDGATLTITRPSGWNFWTDYVSSGGTGVYSLNIANETVNIPQNYRIDVQASTGDPHYEVASVLGLSFTIRELATILVYDPVTPVPYGNPVNISVHYIVSDPESDWYDGQGVPLDIFNITSPGVWNFTLNWTFTGSNGNYVITIFNNTANSVGTYAIDLQANPLNPVYSVATFNNIPFTVRALNTFLTYPVTAKNSWGTNATIGLLWQVIDTSSLYHNGELISGGQLEILSPSNWSYWQDYISTDYFNGSYALNIDKDVVNEIKTYIIDVKAFHLSVNYYGNTTYLGLPFSILQVVTSHTTIINQTYYLDGIGGWPWGDQVNVQIFYNDTDHGTLVPNSNISVRGDVGSPYESGNFTINGIESTVGGSVTGVFLLIINGSVAENAVGYNFYITLYHPTGNYLNHSYIFTISFRKSVSQVILKNPPVFIPWGDNISILFTYNNSEAVGFPGIVGASVNVSVDDPAALGFFNYQEVPAYGPGAWLITMNTTWANVTWNLQDEITFTITAVAPQTIVAQSFHTVFITPLDSDLRAVTWDNSIFLEQANSFNITVELRDRSHFNSTEGDFNLIVNNSYWTPSGSPGQYDNIHFLITTREGQFSNYTWYWGNVSVTAQSPGVFRLTFYFNQTPDYPQIQELLDYLVIIEVRGDRLDASQTQVTVDLKIQTHKTAMTFNWTYANSTITPGFALAPFQTFVDGSSYVYGDIIDVYLYWWDLDSGALNPGISAAFITANWTDPLYYRVFNMYELKSQNESYRGIYWIQIDTNLFSEVVGNYTIEINATLETYQRVYLLTQGYISFTILPVPVNITITEPLVSTPITAYVRLPLNFTNFYTSEPVIVRVQEIDITNVPGAMGGNKWAVSTGVPGELELFVDSNILGLGFHTLTVKFNKTNHELIYKNFTIEIRPIYTEIQFLDPFDERLGDYNLTGIYRMNYTIQFFYTDDPENYTYGYTHIGRIPLASYNISNWQTVGGRATLVTDEVPNGVYKLTIQTSANVGTYFVTLEANRTNFALATKILNITVIQAASSIQLITPNTEVFQIWKFGSQRIEVLLITQYNEPLEGNFTFTIKSLEGTIVATGTFVSTGTPGHYAASIDTGRLNMQEQYTIIINATPSDTNYDVSSKILYAYIKPIWEHPIFIITMIAVAAVVGAYSYRKIKWIRLPREVKAIELAKKVIKSGKLAELPFRDIIDRESMFKTMFADAWAALGIKPPKLVRPEIVLFATELSSILRTRITSPEAETIVNTLRTMSIEDAERYLSEKKVPPEATRRLLTIVGLIEKEKLEVVNFAQVISEIKGTEISYQQAEEIMNTLQSMSPYDADKYLESMVIPAEDRKRLLEMVGVKPFIQPKKIKEPKKPSKKEKLKKEKHPEEKPMTPQEIMAELSKIEFLSEEEKHSLMKDMEKLSLKEQKDILKNLRG